MKKEDLLIEGKTLGVAQTGRAMNALGYESTDRSHIAYYKVIPLKAA